METREETALWHLSQEGIKMSTKWRIYKYRDPDGSVEKALKAGADPMEPMPGVKPYAVEEVEGNLALNEGLQYLIDAICGIEASPTMWDSANARVGVGNSNVAASATQTDLQGASKAYASMDGGYPQRTNQTAKWKGTFGTGDANFAWEEWIVDNGATSGKTLNRKVASKGTKSSGETWSLEAQITFS